MVALIQFMCDFLQYWGSTVVLLDDYIGVPLVQARA